MATVVRVHLSEVVGKGYAAFYRSKKRYRVVKGSRASKKSTTAAISMIDNIMRYPLSNGICVRKVYRTLKDSCFAQLKWAIRRLKVEHLWQAKESPLELTYRPTGQKILFRGMDDPLKITSITVDIGYLTFCWIEEAYEIMNESHFNMLNESLRGLLPENLFIQFTITFNPWSDRHWLKARFFDRQDEDTFVITTNYLCNEFLSEADHKVFDEMQRHNPRRYLVAGLGNWGVVENLVYENWREELFDIQSPEFIQSHPNLKGACGLDFGYTNDPTAACIAFFDTDSKQIFIYDELYQKGLSNKRIFEELQKMGYGKEMFRADSAEPKSIDELKGLGMRVEAADKGAIMHGVQWIQDHEIIVHPRCVNFITEISQYTWAKDKFGATINKPVDSDNHLMDAMRYGLERNMKKNRWIY